MEYPQCLRCQASLICQGIWMRHDYTRCRICNARVMVFTPAGDAPRVTIRVDNCPRAYTGSSTFCNECITGGGVEKYNEYKRRARRSRTWRK